VTIVTDFGDYVVAENGDYSRQVAKIGDCPALKMTQHVKCDYSVTPGKIFAPNFVLLFSRVLSINVVILSEITLRIGLRNWHNAEV